MYFFAVLLNIFLAAGFTWSNVNVNQVEERSRVALRQFSDAYSDIVVDSNVWVASNAVPYEKGEFRLFQMSNKFDANGVTLLLLKEPHRSGAEVVGFFFTAPYKYEIWDGTISDCAKFFGVSFTFAFGRKNSPVTYECVASCDAGVTGCRYRPSQTVRLKKVKKASRAYVGLYLKGRRDALNMVRSDSLRQDSLYRRISLKVPFSAYDSFPNCRTNETKYLKPMIYLYPDSVTSLDVRIGPVSSLAMTYPKDDSGRWQVQAYPDGRLVERKSGKEFYGLYWEGKNWAPPASDTGVVVRGSEFAQALDSLLELKGLNFRERQECVTFWMHSLVNSPWVMIQFFDQEFSQAHPLSVSPAPTTMLRVALSFRKLKSYVPLHPPVLTTPVRRGFTVVEWGGQVND